MSNRINESTIYYIVILTLCLLFLYVAYTTYSLQMNVIEGLVVNKQKSKLKNNSE